MLGSDLAAYLPGLQAEAESMMTTACSVERADVVVWAGSCRIQSRGAQRASVSDDATDEGALTQQYEVHVPVSAGPFAVGDVVNTLGRSFRVAGLHQKTLQTAQRLPVDEIFAALPFAGPDTAVLYRSVGEPVFDATTNVVTPADLEELWSGPCSANPVQSDSANADLVGEQRVSTVTFKVVLPLDVVDIQPDDVIEVTTSRDLWLSPPDPDEMTPATLLKLRVSRVLGGTDAVQREVLAVLNEG